MLRSLTDKSVLLAASRCGDLIVRNGAAFRALEVCEPFSGCITSNNIKQKASVVTPGSPRWMASSSSEQEATTTGGAETIDEIRSRIFGNHLGDGIRSGRKVLARPLLGPAITSYYPKDWFAGDPLLVDLAAER